MTPRLVPKKPWQTPQLQSEEIDETLARPACNFKPPGHGDHRPPEGPPPHGPAFS